MRSLALFMFIQLMAVWAFAQFTTPNLNGAIGLGEYGTHTDGIHQQTSGTNTWYMTWDDTWLYVGVSGTFNPNNDAINLYLDIDPVLPVNGPNNADGNLLGEPYDQVQYELPFRADFFAFAKVAYNEYKTRNGAGAWGAGTTFAIALGASANTLEVRIPWVDITGAGRPASFNWLGYLSYDNGGFNGSFFPVPISNPTVAGGGLAGAWATHYYSIRDTDNGTTEQPFEWVSVAYREDNSAPGTGGYLLPPGTYRDITVNDNSPDNQDNVNSLNLYDNNETSNRMLLGPGTYELYGDLYIGQGSSLFPQDNTAGIVQAIIEVHENVTLTNFGRLDCVPELVTPGDELNRRIGFDVVDTLTIAFSNNLQVGYYRFGDLTVRNGAVVRADPDTPGDVDIEFQFGTIDNNGTMAMVNDVIGSHVDVFTRGFLPGQDNQVYLTSSAGTGVFDFHTLLIGTDVGYLRPVNTALPITINLHQNLEIYSNLICRDGTGALNFAFVGDGAQYIRASLGETSEPVVTGTPTLPAEVYFNNITINNDNGLGNNNAGADVHFESFNTAGYQNIDYIIEGTLSLISGDLVTRDRVAPNGAFSVHELTIAEGGMVTTTGAASDAGANPSCFVDGPLRREVATAVSTIEIFPIGKTATFNGVQVGDYRRLALTVDQTTAASNVYVAEMYLGDRSGTYTWPAPLPEMIANISNIRYWNLQDTAAMTVFDALSVNLEYSDTDYPDVVAPGQEPGLRIVKDNGAGQWHNIQQVGPGGTAAPAGEISSFDISAMPISPFGDLTLANIDGFFNPLMAGNLVLEGTMTDRGAQLTWINEGEELTQLKMMRDAGSGFVTIDLIENPLAGTGETQDASIPPGRSLYRLAGITRGGDVRYSNTISISLQQFTESVWLSHTDRGWKLSRNQTDAELSVELWDLSGKKWDQFEWKSGEQDLFLSSSRLAAGTYLLRWNDGKTSHTALIVN